jgi:hypothetical protein
MQKINSVNNLNMKNVYLSLADLACCGHVWNHCIFLKTHMGVLGD